MEVHEYEGRTEKEAIANAIEAMGLNEEEIDIEVLKTRSGIFGGGKVKIRVHVSEEPLPDEIEPISDRENEAITFLSDLLSHMEIEADVKMAARDEDRVTIEMITDDAGILIGRHGATLEAMQLITNIATGRGSQDGPRVILDTEDYRYRREQSLIRLATKVARDVQRSGRSQLMDPMNPFERRLVHTAISDLEDVTTESEGDGPLKQVRVTYTGSSYQHR